MLRYRSSVLEDEVIIGVQGIPVVVEAFVDHLAVDFARTPCTVRCLRDDRHNSNKILKD